MTKNGGKIYSSTTNFDMFLIKIAIYSSFGLHKGCPLSKRQEKPSALKREHPALQNMKCFSCFLFLCGSFLPSWIQTEPKSTSVFRSETLTNIYGGQVPGATLLISYCCTVLFGCDPAIAVQVSWCRTTIWITIVYFAQLYSTRAIRRALDIV
jgi:hypothetical protein